MSALSKASLIGINLNHLWPENSTTRSTPMEQILDLDLAVVVSDTPAAKIGDYILVPRSGEEDGYYFDCIAIRTPVTEKQRGPTLLPAHRGAVFTKFDIESRRIKVVRKNVFRNISTYISNKPITPTGITSWPSNRILAFTDYDMFIRTLDNIISTHSHKRYKLMSEIGSARRSIGSYTNNRLVGAITRLDEGVLGNSFNSLEGKAFLVNVLDRYIIDNNVRFKSIIHFMLCFSDTDITSVDGSKINNMTDINTSLLRTVLIKDHPKKINTGRFYKKTKGSGAMKRYITSRKPALTEYFAEYLSHREPRKEDTVAQEKIDMPEKVAWAYALGEYRLDKSKFEVEYPEAEYPSSLFEVKCSKKTDVAKKKLKVKKKS